MDFSEPIDQLAMANSVRWYDHVLRRKDSHILRRAFNFEVEGQNEKGRSKREREVKERNGGQREKWRSKRTWKKHVEEESVKIGLRREDALC